MTKPKDKIIRLLEARLARKSDSLAFSRVADSYRLRGDLQHAISICNEGLLHHPENVTARIVLGRCYLDQENLTDAAREFTQVCRLDRHNRAGLRALAEIFIRQGQEEKAGTLYAYLSRLDPADSTVVQQGSKYRDRGIAQLAEIIGWTLATIEPRPSAVQQTRETPLPTHSDLETIIEEIHESEEIHEPEQVTESEQINVPEQTFDREIEIHEEDSFREKTGPLDLSREVSPEAIVEEIAPTFPAPQEQEIEADISTRMNMLFGEENLLHVGDTDIEPSRDLPLVALNDAPEAKHDTTFAQSTTLPESDDFSSRIEQLFGDGQKEDGEVYIESSETVSEPSGRDEDDLLQGITGESTQELADVIAQSYSQSDVHGDDIAGRIQELFAEDAEEEVAATLDNDGAEEIDREQDVITTPSDTPTQSFDIHTLGGSLASADAPTQMINLREIAALRDAIEREPVPLDVDHSFTEPSALDALIGDECATEILTPAMKAREEHVPEVADEISSLFGNNSSLSVEEAPTVELVSLAPPADKESDRGNNVAERGDGPVAVEPEAADPIEDIGIGGALQEPRIQEQSTVPELSEGEEIRLRIEELFPPETTPSESMDLQSLDLSDDTVTVTDFGAPPDVADVFAVYGLDGELAGDGTAGVLPAAEGADDAESAISAFDAGFEELDVVVSEPLQSDVPTGEDIVAGLDSVLMGEETDEGKTAAILPVDMVSVDTPEPPDEELSPLDQLDDVFAWQPGGPENVPVDQVLPAAPPVVTPELLIDDEMTRTEPGIFEFDTPFEDRIVVGSDEEQSEEEAGEEDETPTLTNEEPGAGGEDDDQQPYTIPDHVLTPTLADIYCQQGQTRLAVDIYTRLLDRDPDNERLRKRRDQLAAALVEEQRLAEQQGDVSPPAGDVQAAAQPRRRVRKTTTKATDSEGKPLRGVKIKRQYRERLRKKNG